MSDDDAPLIAPAPLFWRLPGIRHIRAVVCAWRVVSWQDNVRAVGFIPSSFDDRVLRQIWRGIV